MKLNSWLFFAIVLFSFGTVRCQQSKNIEEDSICISILREFYSEYITENSKDNTNQQKVSKIIATYCTKSFQKQLKKSEHDYDVFLNAQDCSLDWLSTLKINKIEENVFIVSYGSKDDAVKIKVIVVKVDNTFKIDNVTQGK